MGGLGQDAQRVGKNANDELERRQSDRSNDGAQCCGTFIFPGFLVGHGSPGMWQQADYTGENPSPNQEDECHYFTAEKSSSGNNSALSHESHFLRFETGV
jgi:hypothetical protein